MRGLCRNAQYEPCGIVESYPNPQPIREIKLGTHTLLHQHKRQSGVENRVDTIFTGVRKGNHDLLSALVVRRAWAAARLAVFGEEVTAPDGAAIRAVRTLTGQEDYDLRHACLTGWLNCGVPPAQVAE